MPFVPATVETQNVYNTFTSKEANCSKRYHGYYREKLQVYFENKETQTEMGTRKCIEMFYRKEAELKGISDVK